MRQVERGEIDRNRILALAQLDFIDRHEVVHFLGSPGRVIRKGDALVDAGGEHRSGRMIGFAAITLADQIFGGSRFRGRVSPSRSPSVAPHAGAAPCR